MSNRYDTLRRSLIGFQGLAFLFTLVRFYVGAFSYYQERTDDTAHSIVRDFTGQVFVFISFYLAAVFIKTVGLFYIAILFIHIIDGVWFLLSARSEDKGAGVRLVASIYLRFDIITVLVILAGLWPATRWPTALYLWQFSCLLVLFVLGGWDFRCLAPFYKDEPGWQDRVWLWRGALPMLPRRSARVADRFELPAQK
jgi:hypothetical protein